MTLEKVLATVCMEMLPFASLGHPGWGNSVKEEEFR
jgi:hypothetical protein